MQKSVDKAGVICYISKAPFGGPWQEGEGRESRLWKKGVDKCFERW